MPFTAVTYENRAYDASWRTYVYPRRYSTHFFPTLSCIRLLYFFDLGITQTGDLTINVIDQRLSHRIAHHQNLANDSVAAVVIRLTIFLECTNNAGKDLMVAENS